MFPNSTISHDIAESLRTDILKIAIDQVTDSRLRETWLCAPILVGGNSRRVFSTRAIRFDLNFAWLGESPTN
jgi:hypothetical protein